MKNNTIFHPTWALQQLPVSLKLSGLEWRFLICSDGKTPVESIQRRLGITEEERETIVAALCESGLLTETTLSLEEYARASVDTPDPRSEPQTLTGYLRGLVPPDATRETDLPAFRPLPRPEETAPVRTMSLQSVIQFILNQSADPVAGQLATYQVFMGISTPLLKKNGITSLRFQDDRMITDPELQESITGNIEKILHLKVPDSIYSH